MRLIMFATCVLLVFGAVAGQDADARCAPVGGRLPPLPPVPPGPEPETPPPTPPPDPTPRPGDPTTPPPDGNPTTPPDENPDTPTTPPSEDEPPTTPPSEDEKPTTPPDEPDTPAPTPTPTPTTPNLPGANPPTSGGTAPTMGGRSRGRRSGGGDSIEWRWSTWWAFNRWNYLPSRNDNLRRNFERFRVVTGEGAMMSDWDQRRDALAKLRATPALLRIMRTKLRPGDEGIQASAVMALARVANTPEAVEAVLGAAENPDASLEVREAATFAAGLLRRSDAKRQMEGARVDALRGRLFKLADDARTPKRIACLAIMAVGVLGDQPRAGSMIPGVVESYGLWRRLTKQDHGFEKTVAYLTALGMQPQGGLGDKVLTGLRDIALGKRVAKRRWNERERSHALCALVRAGGPAWRPAVVRLFGDRRISTEVRRAAFITLGEATSNYDSEERKKLVRAWDAAIKQARDPLTRGLGLIALGRIVAADAADAEGGLVLRTTTAGKQLMKRVRSSAQNVRGFAVMALAIALRDAGSGEDETVKFRKQATKLLLEGLDRADGNAERQSPFVVASGIARLEGALPILERIVADSNADTQLRAFAAVACGQIGKAGPTTVHALKRGVADYKLGNLRIDAALGLSFLTGDRDGKLLREDIERRRYTHSHQIGHVAIALGQMGDLRGVAQLSDMLLDEKSDHGARGAAAVALGLICDPEEKPSLTLLWEDVNYPSRSASLHKALNFF